VKRVRTAAAAVSVFFTSASNMKTIVWAFLTALMAFLSTLPVETRDPSAPRRVDNPAHGPLSQTAHLRELWRVGDSEDDGEIFGEIADVVTDKEGNVFLLDRQTVDVRMFSREGKYLRSFGREGEGPGEFRRPVGLVVTPANQIGVYQSNPLKLVLFDQQGTPAGDLNFEPDDGHPIQYLSRVQCGTDSFLVSGVDIASTPGAMTQNLRVMRFGKNGTFECELTRTERHFDFSRYVVRDDRPPRAVIDAADAAYVSNNWNYEIERRPADCSTDLLIKRAYQHRNRSRQEIEAIESYYRKGGGTRGATFNIAKVDPDIRWMAVDSKRRLWVLSSRGCVGQPADSLGTFDVFDRAGKMLASVDMRGEGNFETDGYYLVGDRFYVLRSGKPAPGKTAGNPEPMSVICYELPI